MPFFEWMESLAVYGGSVYVGPVMNIIHLMAMVVFLGAILIVDLRLLGTGLTKQPTATVARDAQPWLIGGLVVLIATGIPAIMSTATLQYTNSIFWVKMYLLSLGLVFMFTIRRKVAFAEEGRVSPGGEEGGRARLDWHLAECGCAGAADHDDPRQHVRVARRLERFSR